MKITYQTWIVKLNDRLQQANQKTRVISFGKMFLNLNNGTTLVNKEFRMFKSRVMSNVTDLWLRNMDKLCAGEITEKEIKSMHCSIGGKTVQEKYKDIIKSNLNTGTPWNKGTKGLQVGWARGLTKETDPRIAKFSKFGAANGMFGIKMSAEEKEKRSFGMKKAILEGKFTPNSNNRNTHWESSYKNKTYRSSWEAWFQSLAPKALYEELRIEYELNSVKKVYIVDFINHQNRTVIEVKPKELANTEVFKIKWEALLKWAKENNYQAILVTRQWLIENTIKINYADFDVKTANKIKGIYEINKKN